MKLFGFIVLVATASISVVAEDYCPTCTEVCECGPDCPCERDLRAPIGVMGDHVHNKGTWMTSYKYMFMAMEGNRDDDSRVGTTAILAPPPPSGDQFPITPKSMDMQMHMFGAMYGVTDRLTLGLMLPYILNEMDHENVAGVRFSTESKGLGDVELAGLYKLWRADSQEVILGLGLGFPTGSIDEKDTTPLGNIRLPYPMQPGSGSYSLSPAVTYTGYTPDWGWGAQAKMKTYVNENDRDYTLGNNYTLQGWVSRNICRFSALSFRLNGAHTENIDGENPELGPRYLVSTADPDRRAGTRVDAFAGIDYRPFPGNKGLRLALEFGMPLYQYFDGPQLETDYTVIAGAQFSF